MKAVLSVWLRHIRVFRTFVLAAIVGNLGEPLLYLLSLGYGLGLYIQQIEGMSYAQFIAPALLVTAAMYTAVFECTFGTFSRMDYQKTFDAILATPVSIEEIVLAEALWGATKSMGAATIILVVIAAFALTPSWWAIAALPVAFLLGWLFSALSLVVTAFARTWDYFNYYFTLAIAPMFLFSGVFFPISNLPPAAQTLAWLSPLTHAVVPVRALVLGNLSSALWWHILWLIAGSIPLTLLGIYLIRRRMIQ